MPSYRRSSNRPSSATSVYQPTPSNTFDETVNSSGEYNDEHLHYTDNSNQNHQELVNGHDNPEIDAEDEQDEEEDASLQDENISPEEDGNDEDDREDDESDEEEERKPILSMDQFDSGAQVLNEQQRSPKRDRPLPNLDQSTIDARIEETRRKRRVLQRGTFYPLC
jgi:hypothetical protein